MGGDGVAGICKFFMPLNVVSPQEQVVIVAQMKSSSATVVFGRQEVTSDKV